LGTITPPPPTFERLLSTWSWQPIRNCPGRFTLVSGGPHLQISALIGNGPTTSRRVPTTRDTVIVAMFPGGALISYLRDDGTLMHTLNTPDALARKLQQLGIELLPGEP
jgi:hypothetical protein